MRPLLAAALLCSVPTAAIAQTTVTVSHETVAIRDVARSTTPLDASPTAWRGTGQGLVIAHDRANERRGHHLRLALATVGDFSYDNGIQRLSRPDTDRFRAVELRYEYRRHVLRDLVVDGFDLGVGIRAGVSRTTLRRAIDGGLESSDARNAGSVALVALARYQPSSRFSIDAGWANGAHVGRSSERHSASPLASRAQWGGGWLTDLNAAASVGLTARMAVYLRYDQWDDARLSSHRQLTTRRHSVGVGVTYAR